MSITVNRVDAVPPTRTAVRPEPASVPTPSPGVAHHRLLAALRAALLACADLDPDRLGSHTAAGRAAVTLAGVARAAVADLGGDPGTALTRGPGVVVERDLAVATALLAAAPRPGDRHPTAGARLPDLAGEAERQLADLMGAVTVRG